MQRRFHSAALPMREVISASMEPSAEMIEPVPARYVRQSQLCPQLDVSDKNDKKTQDMSDRARYVLHKM